MLFVLSATGALTDSIYVRKAGTAPVKSPVTPWQVLKQRDFGLFWLSLLFSAVGTQISTVAIAWQVYEITNSPFQLGLTGLFRALPVMILSLPGGVLADRVDRRKLLIITQSLAALLSLALGLLSSAGQIRVWHIYAVTFLSGAVGIFDAPARTAMIPRWYPPNNLPRLMRSISLGAKSPPSAAHSSAGS